MSRIEVGNQVRVTPSGYAPFSGEVSEIHHRAGRRTRYFIKYFGWVLDTDLDWHREMEPGDIYSLDGEVQMRDDLEALVAAVLAELKTGLRWGGLFQPVEALCAAVKRLVADMREAAGELMIDIPPIGSDAAKVMHANRMLRYERDELRSTLAERDRELAELKDRLRQIRDIETAKLDAAARAAETTEMLAELARLRKAAPPGPWHQGPHYKTDVESSRGRVANGCPQFTPAGEASAAFIAFCGTHAEALIAAVREVVEERDTLRECHKAEIRKCDELVYQRDEATRRANQIEEVLAASTEENVKLRSQLREARAQAEADKRRLDWLESRVGKVAIKHRSRLAESISLPYLPANPGGLRGAIDAALARSEGDK